MLFRIEDAQIIDATPVMGDFGVLTFIDGTAGDHLVNRYVPIDSLQQLDALESQLSSIPSLFEVKFIPKIMPTGYRG